MFVLNWAIKNKIVIKITFIKSVIFNEIYFIIYFFKNDNLIQHIYLYKYFSTYNLNVCVFLHICVYVL